MTGLANERMAELLRLLDRRCAGGQPLTPSECGWLAAEMRGALLVQQVSDACDQLDRSLARLAAASTPLPPVSVANVVPFPRRACAAPIHPTGGDAA